jgi:hypothetical protein
LNSLAVNWETTGSISFAQCLLEKGRQRLQIFSKVAILHIGGAFIA